ncbi:hypothetical protein LRS13_03925 [Svornostia abyssi]|uniref:Uncharacterized protein n=1 Tax=Svornostia abyssi TaxID=2898438 RepID=A0ABY5PK19_9ACTN|nr:hypothetical protein LRS13_03925 [Parviterribacteraceae bacterium J379]
MARDDEQINIRISASRFSVLAAAAFVDGLRGPSELVRPVIEELADRLGQDEAVRLALQARSLRETEGDGTVRALPRRRRESGD